MSREAHQSILSLIRTYEKSKAISDFIIDNLGAIFIVVDSEGLIYRINVETAKLFNISMEKVAGTPLSNYFNAVNCDIILSYVSKSIEHNTEIFQFEVSLGDQILLLEIQKINLANYYNLFSITGSNITNYKNLLKRNAIIETDLINEKNKILRLNILNSFNLIKTEDSFETNLSKITNIWKEELGISNYIFYEFIEIENYLKPKYFNVLKRPKEIFISDKEAVEFKNIFQSKTISWYSFNSEDQSLLNAGTKILVPIFFEDIPLGVLVIYFKEKKDLDPIVIEILLELSVRFGLFIYQDGLKTELIEKNIQLENAAKLATLGELSAGIAHEINNPLTIIYGKLKLVLSLLKSGKESKEQIFNHIETILKTVDRISSVVRNLKLFSKGENEVIKNDIDIISLIESSFQLFEDRFNSHNIKINFNKGNSKLIIKGNEAQLSQVVLNLISNSIDAVEILNERWISVEVIKVDENQMRIEFTDSGHGISIEHSKKIMQPFFTTKETGKGAGLGLSVTYGIIKAHGGEFYLNRNHHNTQFVVNLPI